MIPSSRNQRQVTIRSLVSFLVNQESKPQLPTISRYPLQFFWLTTIPSSSNRRQAEFRSLVFFVPNQDSPAATNQQQNSAADFLAMQDSQQQQPTTSDVRSLVFYLANLYSLLAATLQQQNSASVFLANQDLQQPKSTISGIPQPSFSLANHDSPSAATSQQRSAPVFLAYGDTQTAAPTNDKHHSAAYVVFLVNQDCPPGTANQQHLSVSTFTANQFPSLRQPISISFWSSVSWPTRIPSSNNKDPLQLSTQFSPGSQSSHFFLDAHWLIVICDIFFSKSWETKLILITDS